MVTAVRPIISAIRATNSTKPGPAQPGSVRVVSGGVISGGVISGVVAPPLALLAMVIPKDRLSREGGRHRREAVTEARRPRKAGRGMAAMRRVPALRRCGTKGIRVPETMRRDFPAARPDGAGPSPFESLARRAKLGNLIRIRAGRRTRSSGSDDAPPRSRLVQHAPSAVPAPEPDHVRCW